MNPNAGGRRVVGSRPMSTAVHRSPKKLWRSNYGTYLTYGIFKSRTMFRNSVRASNVLKSRGGNATPLPAPLPDPGSVMIWGALCPLPIIPHPASQGFGSGSGFAWILINLSCWIRIRIRIQIADPDPGGQK
jgi:hypothetical protein